jgi:hypothetical protein
MKTYGGVTDVGEGSDTRRFTLGEIASSAPWIGGWVGPRAGLDAVEKRQFLPLLGTEPRPSSQ